MNRTMLGVLLALMILVPSMVFAGQGGTKFYGVHFNDSDQSSVNGVYNYITYVSVFNPNDNNAVVNITYYKNDGSMYDNNSVTTFTRTILPKRRTNWRPINDIDPADPTSFKGSYVIEVEEGSIEATSSISLVAGDGHPETGTRFNENDVVTSINVPLHTLASTHMMFDSFIQDDDGDNEALEDGEFVTWFSVNNPSDTVTAEYSIALYDSTGTLVYSDDDLTLAPHAMIATTVGDLGIGLSGQVKGSFVIDCTKGALIANYTKLIAQMGKTELVYTSGCSLFQKNLVVK